MNNVYFPLHTNSLTMFRKIGILAETEAIPAHLQLFAQQADDVLMRVRSQLERGEFTEGRAHEFQQLLLDCCAWAMNHPIIASNNYLKRFSQGVTLAQARHEVQQFSVFGLQFDVAQAKLVANAPTQEAYQERLNVLLNEKGIPYQDGFEGELTGKWNPSTIHFTWMQNMGRGLGLNFEDLGKVWIALPGTKQFVDTTFNTYASTDPNIAAGATFAIENWAANALWKPWIAGMKKLNETLETPVNLGYLTYHEAEESHHSQATLDELLDDFQEPWFDAERFMDGAKRTLTEGVQAYYISQLENLPEKDQTWPVRACEPRRFDPRSLPRVAIPTHH